MWETMKMEWVTTRHVLYATVFLVACGVVVGGLFLHRQETTESRGDRFGVDALREEARSLLAHMTAPDAYAAFKEEIQNSPDEKQHAAAHIFGELLYRKEGIEGVVVCDSSFGFGCYHSFFGVAIAERGPEVARELDEQCFNYYGRLGTGCPHGIGHGLMWYFGNERLPEALSFCDGMRYGGAIGGCTDGVFMEYNEQTMATGEAGIGRRAYDANNPQAPCSTVAKRYRQSCYYQQAAWWYRSFGGDVTHTGKHCAVAISVDDRDACYRGLGDTLAVGVAYDPQRAIAKCSVLTEGEARSRCVEGAAWAFLANPEKRQDAPRVCATEVDQAACMQAAVLIR